MRLAELWGSCATTAAAVAAEHERIAAVLEDDPKADPQDIILHKALALQAQQAAAGFTKDFLREV